MSLFVGRGILTKIFCSPYADDSWELLVTFYKGTLYIMEHETEERKKSAYGSTEKDKLMSYWGYRFEGLCTLSTEPHQIGKEGSDKGKEAEKEVHERVANGIVNTNIQFCSVVRTKLGNFDIVIGAEVDCMLPDKNLQQQPQQQYHLRQQTYLELKTNRVITNQRQRRNFERYKLLKIYFQSWLAGVPNVYVGFHEEGKLKNIEAFKTAEIPRLVRNGSQGSVGGGGGGGEVPWDPWVCINFAERCLGFLWEGVLRHLKGMKGADGKQVDIHHSIDGSETGFEGDREVVYMLRNRNRHLELLEPVRSGELVFVPEWVGAE
jgi:RAT1-interacting protein